MPAVAGARMKGLPPGVDGLVCDLDGVLYRGDEPVEGSARAIAALKERGVRVVFATNNSRSTVQSYVEKLARMDVDASPQEILTSAVVTAEVLALRGARGRRAAVVGGDGLRAALESAGIIVDDDPGAPADLVVVGWDPGFDYPAMRRASMAVRAGAALVATNDDAAFPAPGGRLWPGAGALLASIEVASGARAEVMGKPHRPMMEAAARRLAGARRIALVGDRPETDLAGAESMGWAAILVLSGVTTREQAAALDPQPDLVLDSLADLV